MNLSGRAAAAAFRPEIYVREERHVDNNDTMLRHRRSIESSISRESSMVNDYLFDSCRVRETYLDFLLTGPRTGSNRILLLLLVGDAVFSRTRTRAIDSRGDAPEQRYRDTKVFLAS